MIKYVRFGWILILLLPLLSCVKQENPLPNILVIVADDLGYADMSFLPAAPDDVQTPHIDKLAENGIYFSNAYSTAPICSPSRAALITGQYQQRWGNYWYGEGGLPDTILTIPQLLKKAGYHSVKIGKTHLNGGPAEHPLDHGFDEFLGFIDHTWDYLRLSQKDVDEYGEANAKSAHIGPLLHNREKVSFENGYTTDIFSDKAAEVINNSGDRPFYIQLEYNAVHGPTYVCHPDYLDSFGIEQFPFWDPDKETYDAWHYRTGYLGEIDPDGRKRYLLQLTVMDNGIGRVLNALENSGKLKNTIIFFLSDNGGDYLVYSNNAPLSGHKYMFGEGGIKIPLIVSWPQKTGLERTSNLLVSAMDIFPTIMDAAGIKTEHSIDGISLTNIINGKDVNQHHESLVFSNGYNNWVVRSGDWKLSHHVGWTFFERFKIVEGVCIRDSIPYTYPGGVNLYNIEKDEKELKDLSPEHQDLVKEFTQIHDRWKEEMSLPRTREGQLKPQLAKGEINETYLSSINAEVIISNAHREYYPGYVADGYPDTFWSTIMGNWQQPLPHELIIKLPANKTIHGFKLLPGRNQKNQNIKNYFCSTSLDGVNWSIIHSGILPDNHEEKSVIFSQSIDIMFFKLTIEETYNTTGSVRIAEIDLLTDLY